MTYLIGGNVCHRSTAGERASVSLREGCSKGGCRGGSEGVQEDFFLPAEGGALSRELGGLQGRRPHRIVQCAPTCCATAVFSRNLSLRSRGPRGSLVHPKLPEAKMTTGNGSARWRLLPLFRSEKSSRKKEKANIGGPKSDYFIERCWCPRGGEGALHFGEVLTALHGARKKKVG